MTRSDAPEELWPFVLRVYGGDGVQSACLNLQERCSIDIPVLLFAAWLGQRSVPLDDAAMRHIDQNVGEWRREIVHVLRQVRHRLKTGPAPAPAPATEALRNTVKGAELAAERLELALLEEMSRTLAPAPEQDRIALIQANLFRVAQYFGGEASTDLQREDLMTVSAAV